MKARSWVGKSPGLWGEFPGLLSDIPELRGEVPELRRESRSGGGKSPGC